MQIRRAAHRGHADHGWLKTWHTFSFASYHDPQWVQHGGLRVLNDDLIAPHSGFPTHPHHEMEIITYPVAGELTHTDSMGHSQKIRPGVVQVMSAGTGLTHGEFNRGDATARIIQCWIIPNERGLRPRYSQKQFDPAERVNHLRPLVSGDGREGTLVIGADALLSESLLEPGHSLSMQLGSGRLGWLQIVSGSLLANGDELATGDGLALSAGETLELAAHEADAQLLFFDLAG
ncbi:MAG: pirin family protein [Planctomycetales bacterium]|nr:pirin family protein [bacterium]UNM09857.1 MAG: pirin family protein [Planctomycetales bacterium]